ncbi:MAG: transglycosylase SLT domain-containing protein [Bacillota bacterium]
MSRPTGGRTTDPSDRRLTAGLVVFLGLLFLVFVAYKPERVEAIDSRAQADATLTRLRQLREQMDDLASRLEEDRAALELRERALTRARAAGTPDWVVERAWDQAHEAGLDPVMVLQLIEVESGWDADLVHRNSDGSVDRGLMQLNSGTWPWLAAHVGLKHADPLDPEDNLAMGTWYLAYLLRRYGSEEAALTAYNRGEQGLEWHIASRGTARSSYSTAVLGEER